MFTKVTYQILRQHLFEVPDNIKECSEIPPMVPLSAIYFPFQNFLILKKRNNVHVLKWHLGRAVNRFRSGHKSPPCMYAYDGNS